MTDQQLECATGSVVYIATFEGQSKQFYSEHYQHRQMAILIYNHTGGQKAS